MFELLQSLILVARQHPESMGDLVYYLEMAALEADLVRRQRPPEKE